MVLNEYSRGVDFLNKTSRIEAGRFAFPWGGRALLKSWLKAFICYILILESLPFVAQNSISEETQ